ncbi:MAG: hypothetical protein IJ572_00765 [Bacilli bacterium]|nr:hypothetical protein [Bacilli bacterium]
MKRKIVSFILGALIFGSISTVFAFSFLSSDTEYIPSDNTWDVDNVSDAIDYLHILSDNPLYKVSSTNVLGTYGQAHGTSNYNVSINTTKGKYLVALIYSYSGAMTTCNYVNTRDSTVYLTPTNGTCTIIDSKGFTSSGSSRYNSSQYFDQKLDFVFYRCTFAEDGTLVSNNKGTNSYDPDSYVLRYIKFE